MESPGVQDVLQAVQDGRPPSQLASEILDFTRQGRSVQDALRNLAHAAICFANAAGGTLVLGIREDVGGADAFEGTSILPEQVKRRVHELTVPPLLVDAQQLVWRGVPLVVVRVPEGVETHADTEGRAPRRVGTDCRPMSPAEHTRLRAERLGIDWTAETTDHGLDHLAPTAVEVARAQLLRLPDSRRELATASTVDLLRALGVLVGDRLSRAGALLLCATEASRSTTLVYQYRPTPGGEPQVVERLGPPLLPAFVRLLELVAARRATTPLQLPDGQLLHLEDFPLAAVREGLANALLHRDYLVDEPVAVEHAPDVLRVVSPGPLVSGVTVDNILTHPSRARNPAVADVLRVLGLAEETGRGVDRIYREMLRTGKGVPSYEVTFDAVRLTLVGGAPSTRIARFLEELPARERDDTDTLLVLFHCRSSKTVQARTIAPLLQKSAAEAETVLQRLADDEVALLAPTRSTANRRHPVYELRAAAVQSLGPALGYRRRTGDEIDRKVIAHVREYGRISNKTVRNLFDVDVYRARELLADLVRREVLTKTTKQQRGPGVEYGPGACFPRS